MEPSVFLFFFRAVFRQLHTQGIEVEDSPSPPRGRGVPQPPATTSGRISVSPPHCGIWERSRPAHLLYPFEPVSKGQVSARCRADPRTAAVMVHTHQPMCDKFSDGPGDSLLFGEFSDTAA